MYNSQYIDTWLVFFPSFHFWFGCRMPTTFQIYIEMSHFFFFVYFLRCSSLIWFRLSKKKKNVVRIAWSFGGFLVEKVCMKPEMLLFLSMLIMMIIIIIMIWNLVGSATIVARTTRYRKLEICFINNIFFVYPNHIIIIIYIMYVYIECVYWVMISREHTRSSNPSASPLLLFYFGLSASSFFFFSRQFFVVVPAVDAFIHIVPLIFLISRTMCDYDFLVLLWR